jgi:hypothetical protein
VTIGEQVSRMLTRWSYFGKPLGVLTQNRQSDFILPEKSDNWLRTFTNPMNIPLHLGDKSSCYNIILNGISIALQADRRSRLW